MDQSLRQKSSPPVTKNDDETSHETSGRKHTAFTSSLWPLSRLPMPFTGRSYRVRNIQQPPQGGPANRVRLTRGRHKAMLMPAPKAIVPRWFQSATTVCRLAPVARKPTTILTGASAISYASVAVDVILFLFLFYFSRHSHSERCVPGRY